MESIKLGISSCLLGNNVRYDGGHKLDRFLTDTLGKYVDYVPVCPEVECGLSIPRPSMRLEGNPGRAAVNRNQHQRRSDRTHGELCAKKSSPTGERRSLRVYF